MRQKRLAVISFIILTTLAPLHFARCESSLNGTNAINVNALTSKISVPASSTHEPRRFTPHVTSDARTRDWGKMAFQRSPGANINTTFLLSALTVTALPRFEIGTTPALYSEESHDYNLVAKLQMWRDENTDVALGIANSRFRFSSLLLTNQLPHPSEITLEIDSIQVTTNFRPKRSSTWLSLMVGRTFSMLRGDALGGKAGELRTLRYADEYALDVSHPLNDRFDLSVGCGLLRPFGLSAYEETAFGFGSTVAWYRPRQFFSKPSLGLNLVPSTQQVQFLFSSAIL